MKRITLFLITLSFLYLTSCQKEIEGTITDVDTSVSYLVKTYTETVTSTSTGNISTTYKLSYDANNRITSMISVPNPGDKFMFTYTSDTKFIMELFSDNLLSIHHESYANSLSLIDSTFQYNDTQDTMTEKYIYNASNQCIQTIEYEHIGGISGITNITTNTYDANGNLTKTVDTKGSVETYEYYTDLIYRTPIITAFFISPITTEKKQLVKKRTTNAVGGEMVFDVTYTFDTKGRISTEKEVNEDGDTLLKTYTY
jgi:hypothetical protein